MPRVQFKLWRVLHAHRGAELLEGIRNQDNDRSKRAMVRFREAREKGAIAFVQCLGVSNEEKMGHATVMVTGRRPAALMHLVHKDGMELPHPQPSTPLRCGKIPL